ncbi:unnamed protein product [Acanthoscelides obtectus]|uniref:Transposase n=1 Tax=Acanthoscelides obtectus TaxID=200917 RepID=A0A9P0PDU4_ACAOB|nr:unnamed protein product [Acanthoscelides obtectus]CAK1665434.1 Histone-lysine N-methyltransferase SETMAR [Acanthoscelides obtectus]
MELNREHFRAIIYYNFQRQLSQQECLAELLSVEWENVNDVRKLIIEDRHVTYREIEAIVSGDASWIYCYEPENKRQSAVWVFQEQRTVTADWYTTICLPKIITGLRKINPEGRIILHQDNASSHTAQKTRQYLTEENMNLLDHSPYSPDLSPNDFFTFPKIENRLRGQRFQSPEEAVWNKCFENLFERMQMCINLRGKYFENQ